MKEINTYIVEKLRINKDSKIRNSEDYWDARTFAEGDIVYIHPNIVRGLNKPGKGGEPEFFKIAGNDGKKLKISVLGSKVLMKKQSNGHDYGKVEPDLNKVKYTVSTKIHNNGFAYYSGMVLYLYEGEPLEYWK